MRDRRLPRMRTFLRVGRELAPAPCSALALAIGLALLLSLLATRARAEDVIETWRSPFGHMRSVSVNSADSSVWVASGGSVLHLGASRTLLSQTNGFVAVEAVCVNPADGSCWVGDSPASGRGPSITHLAEDGGELLRLDIPPADFLGHLSLSVNPTDGSCWVGESLSDAGIVHLAPDGTELWRGGLGEEWEAIAVSVNPADGSCWVADGRNFVVAHLAEDGTELWRRSGLTGTLAVNPTDGSCWVLDMLNYEVIHLAEDGTELWRGEMAGNPRSISVNPADGSCWVVAGSQVVHLAQDGAELWRGGGFDFELHGSVSVNSTDGSCWLIHVGGDAYGYGLELIHLSESGAELWRQDADFARPYGVATNLMDGSCWVADEGLNQVVRLAEDGTELLRLSDYGTAWIAVNPTDGSCWVADWLLDGGVWTSQLVHLAEDGSELLRSGDYAPSSLSVNPTDGSCWFADDVSDSYERQVVHLAQNGSLLWRSASIRWAECLSVNPTDGSCWVAQAASGEEAVVHLAADGTELWRGGGLTYAVSVSANPVDGSCWVAGSDYVVHLAEDGTELSRAGLGAWSISVNPVDGSCWVVGDSVVHLAEDGTELWRGSGGVAVSVNPMDGSCWVAQHYNGQVVRLEVVGYEGPHFPDIMPYHWAFADVEACANAEIVGGYGDGLYHPANPVTRDQMAVFISRSICTPTGEAGLVDYVPPAIPSFSDVPTDFWCYKYIEYAVEHNVVGGYGDGTYQPGLPLDRGQMAVFIARAMAGDDESVPDPTGDPSFPDVPADFWSYRHIEYIASEGVAGGYFDGLYHPENPVDRAQMAVFICRAFDLPT